jgi:enamine deaminase RidA (YjgF/YER057c/UK114 family)
MRRTALAPEWDAPEGAEPAGALGQVVHRPDGMAVTLSGLRAPEPAEVEAQTREALSTVREVVCDDLGGELMDVLHLRVFVRESALTPEARADVHRVRRQSFEWPYYPSATVVGAASLVEEAALVELETEVFVPDDGWETDVLELQDARESQPSGD